MSDVVHVVCLEAPSPPSYGGAIDMYYKVRALASIGKEIILHYYSYHKNRNAGDLEQYCVEVNSYSRKRYIESVSFFSPYIVRSRVNAGLIRRLNEDAHPILLEGIHCTAILPYINKERVVLRMHNNEATYYQSLAASEKHPLKRLYFSVEARLLKKHQQGLAKDLTIASLSDQDLMALKNDYGFRNAHFIPCFTPWRTINAQEGKGNYCLYHGNMAVSENESAAAWLTEEVFSRTNVPFVIAGSGISTRLATKARKYKNCKLVFDPPPDELNGLIRDAHINILPSKNNTGVNLMLLHALFDGRFCIPNDQGVAGSHVHSGVYIANEPDEYIQLIQKLFEQEFTADHIKERKSIQGIYDNHRNAQLLSALW